MSDPVGRFSNRVENYVKYRPSYPAGIFDVVSGEMELARGSVVADIGSGTGISARLFLERGYRVIGIEPNAAMRAAADVILSEFPSFSSVDGTAEATTLPDRSADLIVAAQAYHWFDAPQAAAEFRRVLKSGGWLAVIWNERLLDANEFLVLYEALLKEFANDYDTVRHDRIDLEQLNSEFRAEFRLRSFPNAQTLDFEGLKGRLHSSSYMPAENDPRSPELAAKLRSLFDKYSEQGRIQLLYQTNIFYTRL
jgi:SAM-dependent methyltransferase